VSVEAIIDSGLHQLVLRGRVDAVYRTSPESCWVLEEIKTTFLEHKDVPLSAHSVHLAQAKVYAWMVARERDLTELDVQLTWLKLPEYRPYSEVHHFSFEQLEHFALEAVEIYLNWLETVTQHKQSVIAECQKLSFPFSSYRPWQRELCVEIFKSIRDGKDMLFEAPTGIGKSISTLFPAFKAIGEEKVEQILFVTAKTSGRKTVLDTCRLLSKTAKVLVLNAREKTCFCLASAPTSQEAPCDYRLGYYDRLIPAMTRCFEESLLDPQTIANIAQEFRVCPFNLSLAMIPWVDLVVADYNYVFDPLIAHSHFKDNGKQAVLLVDEAHNLIDRSRQMFSAEWSESLALQVIESKKLSGELVRSIHGMVENLMQLEQQLKQSIWIEPNCLPTLEPLAEKARLISGALIDQANLSELTQDERALLNQVMRLAMILELILQYHCYQNYACFLTRKPGQLLEAYQMELKALNAAPFLTAIYSRFQSCILFSATLSPEPFVRNALGCLAYRLTDESLKQPGKKTDYVQLPSPFAPEQQGVFIAQAIDTRYRFREHYTDEIAHAIHRVYSAKTGNYLACFSSYAFMNQVVDRYRSFYGDQHLRIQSANESNQQRDSFIKEFFAQSKLLGFVILGGSYTEGIDFKGDALHGVIVVGTGLPQFNLEQEAIKECFERQGTKGFDMAYRFPGLQRVLQSAGRVVRSETDRGVIVLLDRRFLSPEYRNYLPAVWRPQSFATIDMLSEQLGNFWSG
jgi:DNA excision repair protein ERCC-2